MPPDAAPLLGLNCHDTRFWSLPKAYLGIYMSLILALTRQRQKQAALYEFKASLLYKLNSMTARTGTQRNPVSKNQNKPGWGGTHL